MFQGLFGWLRSSVRAAVIGGVQDAVNDLTTADAGEAAPVLRLTFAAAREDETPAAKGRRKAE